MTRIGESEVTERARQALNGSPVRAMRGLKVDLSSSGLLISGTVSRYYHKQLAQELVLAVVRDVEIKNSVEVRSIA